MAFLIVQHLEPNHENLLVDLLSARTSMKVLQASEGMEIEEQRVYIIPPGFYLSVDQDGLLRLSRPPGKRRARLPFDYLLNSLAKTFSSRLVCVVMSGTGTDGSSGLKAVKAGGGLILAQEPSEADYDGMPRAAIATGLVDSILPAAKIAQMLVARAEGGTATPSTLNPSSSTEASDWVADLVDLLRKKTARDFTHYKRGTLQRHFERKMAMSAVKTPEAFLETLRNDDVELDRLASELLINVTSFFRDASVFESLASEVIPELIRKHPSDRPVRAWVAGCSSGEEAYSLAMLFIECIKASGREIKLQLFASDADAEAIAAAREGLYPSSIEHDVIPKRLERFFIREDHFYRTSPELRASVVFSVHDILSDPPFSKLDFISCRNLLIYLLPEAQGRVISLFNFALQKDGLLLVGNAETVSVANGTFAVVSKSSHIYRRVRSGRPASFGLPLQVSESKSRPVAGTPPAPSTKEPTMAEFCTAKSIEAYGPASVLINPKLECVFSQGPIDRYLKVAPGRASQSVIAMAREGVKAKLLATIQGAQETRARQTSSPGRIGTAADAPSFIVVAEPVTYAGEPLLMAYFLEQAAPLSEAKKGNGGPQFLELQRELEATKIELATALRSMETAGAEQRAINEETLSVNEEYQATNEELMASKEELQSLNEELNALNAQLQETLDRQRTTADDLQNVLFSTDVATIFLDTQFKIRFFTPATKALFNVIPSDVGRPLSDLHSLASDGNLIPDAQEVLNSQTPIEREVSGEHDAWFIRRIFPYRTRDNLTEGVVITFADVTDQRRAAVALSSAKRQAELASTGKSRFLAAASHDLRQPLQTLSLLQGMLESKVTGEKEQRLVGRMSDALGAMTGMLNTLLDINQIEVGAVKVERTEFALNGLLDRLRGELTVNAQAQGLALKILPCGATIRSDARLLEQMMRNLLSNALKYTPRGRVLLGCRRSSGKLRIEIWDTGAGIPTSELLAIFEEYHQLDNPARERSRGLGLGLSIVKSLGDLLGHRVRVRSLQGKGSVFSIEVPIAPSGAMVAPTVAMTSSRPVLPRQSKSLKRILIVEDDPEVRGDLALFLREAGYETIVASDGPAALALLALEESDPDLVLADYNLPNGLTGIDVFKRLHSRQKPSPPFIILTGDISIDAMRDIAQHGCLQFSKPANLRELTQAIAKLTMNSIAATTPESGEVTEKSPRPKVFIVDDDAGIRDALSGLLVEEGHKVEAFASCEAFLAGFQPERDACLLVDAYLPGMSGLDLLRKLRADSQLLPAIMITGNGDVSIAVKAMKAGAVDFIEKPVGREELVASLARALELSRDTDKVVERREAAVAHLEGLTPRQIQVMEMVLEGHPSKNIAADLGISQRTVENHRMRIMRRTGSKSLPALARLALIAASGEATPDEADKAKSG